jgi:serine/threonine protein kinase
MGGTLMTGSLYWMAPEVVTNAGQGYNSKIDLWSLGCVVLEMLSGARPWQGLEMMPIILKVRSSIELRHSLSTPSADVEPSFPFVARSRRTASDAGRSRSFARGGRLRLRQVVRR